VSTVLTVSIALIVLNALIAVIAITVIFAHLARVLLPALNVKLFMAVVLVQGASIVKTAMCVLTSAHVWIAKIVIIVQLAAD
jgi:hypothetical protein